LLDVMSKGKATRSSTATSSTPAPAPTISNDILTGRFTEHEWNTLTDVEDGEELVFDLMETVVNGVLNVIHEKHMETNLIPFSLDWAENIMEKLIDWQFLTHDSGESKSETNNWLPDQEAARVPLDSWGRGCVPSRIIEEIIEEQENTSPVELVKQMDTDSLQHESSGEETSDREDLESIKRNPDLHKLNQLREQLKYYKISVDDIATLEKIDKPSDTLHLLHQVLGVIQDHPDKDYEYSVAVANLKNTKKFIETFGPRPISESTMALLKPYMDNIILHPDHVTQLASPATRGLSTWLHTAYTYQTLCNVLNVETSIDFRILKSSIIELKSLSKPPVYVKDVMCAVITLLHGKFIKDYAQAQKGFADQSKLLDHLDSFDCTKLSQKFIAKFKKEFMNHTTAELKCVNVGCSFLYQWCEDQIYGSGSIIVRPPEKPKQRKVRRRIKVIEHELEEEEMSQISELGSGSMNNMMPHQSAAIVKAQQGRPPGKKEVQYDDKGNVVSVLKIKKLPTNRVKTTYEILDSSTLTSKKNKLKPLKGAPSIKRGGSTSFLYETQDHTPVPPSFVDAVTASPGVVIKQGSKIKRGPDSVVLSPIEQNNLSRFQNILTS